MLRANPFLVGSSIYHHCGSHAINFLPEENWEQFLGRQRSASTRQQLRRKMRTLASLGTVSFQIAGSPPEAESIVENCLSAKSRQLAKLGHHDPFAAPEVRNFLRSYFSDQVGRSSWAVALKLNDKCIASAFGFVSSGEWLLYQMAMDADGLEHSSPGTQLLVRLMQHCISVGAVRLDLGLGDENYKYEWCDEHSKLLNCTVSLTLRGALAGAAFKVRDEIMNAMAAHPGLYSAGKVIKRELSVITRRC